MAILQEKSQGNPKDYQGAGRVKRFQRTTGLSSRKMEEDFDYVPAPDMELILRTSWLGVRPVPQRGSDFWSAGQYRGLGHLNEPGKAI